MSGTPKTWRLGTAPWAEAALTAPRARVIVDNDFSGDPDDFFQLVHHLLSPTVEIPFVVASHLRPGDPMDPSGRSAQNAERLANEICTLMGLEHDGLVVRGAEEALRDRRTPRRSAAARRIVDEAMREDTDLPLYYAAGGGLTDLASACLLEPRMYGSFRAVPDEIEESARLDGASTLRIFWQICCPLVKPTLAALLVLDFVATWNEYAMASTILQSSTMATVPLAVQSFSTQHGTDYGPLNAFIVMTAIPVLLVYLLFQRYFVSGAFTGAVKG